MDLFVINRYKDPSEEITDQQHENIRLQKLKQKIEERKKANLKTKAQEEIVLPSPKQSLETTEHCHKGENIVIKQDEEKEELQESIVGKEIESKSTEPKLTKSSSEFKVLGTTEVQKKVTVRRVLPYWLSHSSHVSTNLQTLKCKVEDQEWLHPTLKTTLVNDGITQLFPVQEIVVPFILNQHKLPYPLWPHDVCVSAPTGSGKTLSFVLPIVQVLMNDVGHHIRALIVLPVQELAAQVCKVFKKFAGKVGLKVALLSGSTPLRQEQQQIMRYTESLGWISDVDIVVCTAGRLVEHILNTEGFTLKQLKFLVIDEADRIMDHIQNDWLYHLDRHIKLDNELMTGKVTSSSWTNLKEQKRPPHKLLFSATLSQDPEKLEQWGLFQPKLFSADATNILEDDDNIKKYTVPEEVKEQFIICDSEKKPLVLYHLLVDLNWKRVIVFTNAGQSAHRLSLLLSHWAENKIKVAELSGALDRTTREKVLKKFQQTEVDVLISTDALARGIDIPNCDYVISYDPPKNIKTYVHRVGRTGRAGREGHAITVLQPNQVNLFKDIIKTEDKEQLPQKHIEDEVFENLSESYEKAIHATKFLIHEEISTKVKKSIALKRGAKQKTLKRKSNLHKKIDNSKRQRTQ